MQSNKATIIKEVTKIILKFAKPTRIYLYGSEATGESKLTSDLDIAFDDEKFNDIHLIKEEILKINTLLKIDVLNITRTDKRFRNRVESIGKVLYSASKKLRAEDGLYNFRKALEKFTNAIEMENEIKLHGFEDMYLDLIVKRFEFTYEMSWKALKRLLEFLGLEINSPRMVFQEGFAQGLIKDESIWLDMIEQRNLTSNVYDEYQIKEILNKTENYNKAFKELKKAIETALK
jgi:nucleotidyltransferase substrate binding protein (TIGR01987 family)